MGQLGADREQPEEAAEPDDGHGRAQGQGQQGDGGQHADRGDDQADDRQDLTPPLTGVLRAVANGPGRSQQEIATQLGTVPARMVALVDDLDQRGLVERTRNPDDRRLYALYLTDLGRDMLTTVGQIAAQHDDVLLTSLDPTERQQLHTLLSRIAAQQGLTTGVHPGYRNLGTPEKAEKDENK